LLHKELVCEECCDLSHHKDHNNQILLLKAAASNFLGGVEQQLDSLVKNRQTLTQFKDFNIKKQIRQ